MAFFRTSRKSLGDIGLPSCRKVEPKLTGAQLRAARGLLNLSAEALADHTKVSLRTIRRAEHEDGAVGITAANAERIKSVLEDMGICFIGGNDGGVGVRLNVRKHAGFHDK